MRNEKILVIGASGFVGRHVAQALLADNYEVRSLARNPSRIQDLAASKGEIVQGDISDPVSMHHALDGVQAVYICVHTLSPQQGSTQDFIEIEINGLQNIVTACRTHGVSRLIYLTFLGIAPDAQSVWVRERWKAEQFLLNSGLDVTIIRPGYIIGVGGNGFNMMVSQAKKRVAVILGNGRKKNCYIAIDDLVYYLVGVLNDARAYGQCYDVGQDDILTTDQMMDIVADILGRNHPIKIDVPLTLLSALSPLIERMSKYPKGSIKGFLVGKKADITGDPKSIRKILPRPLLSYRQAVEQAFSRSNVNEL